MGSLTRYTSWPQNRSRKELKPRSAAAAFKEGHCFRIDLTLRAVGVWKYSDGRRWKTTLIRVEGIAE